MEALRRPKVFGMALFDWATSLAAAYLVGTRYLHIAEGRDWALWLLFWVLLGVAVHRALGIQTQLGRYLGLNENNSDMEI